jgi:hypothetical protein
MDKTDFIHYIRAAGERELNREGDFNREWTRISTNGQGAGGRGAKARRREHSTLNAQHSTSKRIENRK